MTALLFALHRAGSEPTWCVGLRLVFKDGAAGTTHGEAGPHALISNVWKRKQHDDRC